MNPSGLKCGTQESGVIKLYEHEIEIAKGEVGLLLDEDDDGVTTSGFFEVPSVDEFYLEHADAVKFIVEPKDIPPGRYAIFQDPSGNAVRIFDNSKDN